jgi:segregation and condensation protein B
MEELEILPEGASLEQEAPVAPAVLRPEAESPVSEIEEGGKTVESTSELDEGNGKTADATSEIDEAASNLGEGGGKTAEATSEPSVSMEELLASSEPKAEDAPPGSVGDSQLRAVLEAIVYVAEEPLTLAQISTALQQPADRIRILLEQLVAEFDKPEHGVTVREVAGGYKMATKAEHHDAVRSFVKSLKPPLKLSLPALETLAVIAYKQPVTSPEIMEIRGVRGAGVLNTLLDRKLIAAAGRKNVIGKPILYKTTKDFLIQFGLKDLSELPSLKEFEEIRRMAFADTEVEGADQSARQAVSVDAVPETPLGEVAGGPGPENMEQNGPQAGEAGGTACPTSPSGTQEPES